MKSPNQKTNCSKSASRSVWPQFLLAAAACVAGPALADGASIPGTARVTADLSRPILLAQAAKASPAAARADLEALLKAARAEGELTFYVTATENVAKRTADAFAAKYGVKATYLRLPGNTGKQRYANEAESGNVAADLFVNFGTDSTPFAEEGIKKGWMEPIASFDLPIVRSGEFPSRFLRGSTAVIQVAPWQITFNTDKLKPADYPKDWPDLLSPKYKGQILVADARCCAVLMEFWKVMLDKYGEGFMTQLGAQIGRQYASGVPAVQGLAAGEGAIIIPTIVPQAQAVKDKGAPVGSTMPAFTTGMELHVLMTARAKARHPNAARLFANYMMSPEGNKVVNDDPGGFTVYESTRLPAQYVPSSVEAIKSSDQLSKMLGLK